MYRVIVIALAGFGLAGCASFSTSFFTPAPQMVTLQLESAPPGAEATTSAGGSCKTPCSVTVPAADNLTVTFSLNKFNPETVPVQIIKQSGDFAGPPTVIADPNPVVAELQPAKPTKRPAKRPARRAEPQASARPAAGAQSSSPFPNPR